MNGKDLTAIVLALFAGFVLFLNNKRGPDGRPILQSVLDTLQGRGTPQGAGTLAPVTAEGFASLSSAAAPDPQVRGIVPVNGAIYNLVTPSRGSQGAGLYGSAGIAPTKNLPARTLDFQGKPVRVYELDNYPGLTIYAAPEGFDTKSDKSRTNRFTSVVAPGFVDRFLSGEQSAVNMFSAVYEKLTGKKPGQ